MSGSSTNVAADCQYGSGMSFFQQFDEDFYDDPNRLCPAAYLFVNGFEDAARAFRDAYGGACVYIPKRPQHSDYMVKVVGMDAAILLAEELGGAKYEISRRGLNARSRIKLHVALFSLARIPAWMIAIILNINERQIYRIRSTMRDGGVQMPQIPGGNPHNKFLSRKV